MSDGKSPPLQTKGTLKAICSVAERKKKQRGRRKACLGQAGRPWVCVENYLFRLWLTCSTSVRTRRVFSPRILRMSDSE